MLYLQFAIDSHGAWKIFAVSEGDDFLVPCLKETKAILPQRGAKNLDTDIAYTVVKRYFLIVIWLADQVKVSGICFCLKEENSKHASQNYFLTEIS